MEVLITGGYGFIGSFVAERFHKEGHQVVILDNLQTGNRKNVSCKHKSFILDVEDPKCEEVFLSHKFDVVIHLAAQVDVTTSMDSPSLDTQTNILGLVNILQLSSKYGVSKFVFASSAAVYGADEELPLHENSSGSPISMYGMNKLIGEFYCEKWTEIFNLDTICFRFSNVYGPRQGTKAEGGVVSIFLNKLMSEEKLTVFGDGYQTRDFIYVEDVADGIYRASFTEHSGVLNLSTNTECSINRLLEILNQSFDIKGIDYQEAKAGDIYKSRLDNTKVKRVLDWVPLYSLEEGLQKTIDWAKEEHEQQQTEEIAVKKDSRLRSLFTVALPYLENGLAALLLFASIQFAWFDHHFIDLKLVYIIVMGAFYGTKQSILSVILASLLYLTESWQNGRELVSLLYDPDSLLRIAIYLIVGIIVGYSIDKRNREVLSQQLQVQNIEEKYEFLTEIYKDTRVVKEQLQNQIVNSEDSVGKIYNITKELDSLEPEVVFQSAVHVLEQIMKTDEISIYTLNKSGHYMRLMAKSKKPHFTVPRSLKIADNPYLTEILGSKQVFFNQILSREVPLMSAPIIDNGVVVAIVSVHTYQFERYSLYTHNLFKVAVNLITSALSRAFRYLDATYGERYVEGTNILIPKYFAGILDSKEQAKKQLNIEYAVLRLDEWSGTLEELSNRVSGSLREFDYLGMDDHKQIYIVLSNSGSADAGIVLERLTRLDVLASLVEERAAAIFFYKEPLYA